MKKAFTLIEVNLAILVMAGGILSVVVLYSLGFREARQSGEDIQSAAYADAVMGPLVAALSDPNLTWSDFNSVETVPAKGWGGYLNESTGAVEMNTDASTVFGDVKEKLSSSQVSMSYPSGSGLGGLYAGLVVSHEDDSGIVKIGFRASKRKQDLLTAPLYYTEVHWQGFDSDEQQ